MNLQTPIQIELTPSIILAIFFLIVVSWMRTTSLAGKKNWDKVFQPVAPSLKESPSPAAQMRNGLTGCATWMMGWTFLILFIALFWDFLLFDAKATTYVFTNIDEWILIVARETRDLLRSLARLLI